MTQQKHPEVEYFEILLFHTWIEYMQSLNYGPILLILYSQHKQNSNSSCSSSVSGNSSSSSGVGKRRSSQPVTGSPREPDFTSGLNTRRSSEGTNWF